MPLSTDLWCAGVRSRAWCPLVGGFPPEADGAPGSPPYRLVKLIEEARRLWGLDLRGDPAPSGATLWPGFLIACPVGGPEGPGEWLVAHNPPPELLEVSAARMPATLAAAARAVAGCVNLLEAARVSAMLGCSVPEWAGALWMVDATSAEVVETLLGIATRHPAVVAVGGLPPALLLALVAIMVAAEGLADLLEDHPPPERCTADGHRILEPPAAEAAAALLAAAHYHRAQELVPDARLGAARRVSLEDFGRRRGTTLRGERADEHARWRAAAAEIAAERPGLKKTELARLVRRRLGLPDEIRTIRRYL